MSYTTTSASVLMTDYIEPNVVDSFAEEDTTFRAFMEGPKVRTNARGRRLLVNVKPNPSYGSPAEGAKLPVGGSGLEIEAKVFYLNQFLVGEVNKEVLEQDNDKAVIDLLKNRQSRDTATFRQRQNLWMFGVGTGALGVISDASGGTTVVFGGDYKAENIIEGSRLWFYTAAGVRRVGGGAVTSVVLTNDGTTITLDAVPNDLAATDIAVYEESFGNAPHGLGYHITDVAGDWFGINTATNPNVRATVHDAQNNSILPGMLDLVTAKARKRMGVSAPAYDRQIICHLAQSFNYMQLGYTFTIPQSAAGGNDRLDLGFKKIAHNGMRWREDANCQRSIIYGIRLKDFAIVFVRLPGFYNHPNGDKLWVKPTEGGLYDRVQYALVARYDLLCRDRTAQWKIENLPYVAGL